MKKYIFLLLVLAGFLVYFPGLTGYFTFDDTNNIIQNPQIQIQEIDIISLKKAAFSSDVNMFGRPISFVSFALNYYFSGLNPYYFKLTNVVIHLVNGFLVFALTGLLLKAHRYHNRVDLDDDSMHWIKLAIAGAWLLHPLNLTSVLYVVQRMTSLSALFSLSGLLCYTYGRARLLNTPLGWVWILSSFLLFTPLAILSKENAALLPAFIFLVEIAFFRFHTSTLWAKRGLIALFGIVVLLPVLFGVIYLVFNPNWLTAGYAIRDFSLTERFLTEMRVLWFYIRLIVAPDLVAMGLYHDDIELSKSLMEPISTLFAVLGVALLLLGGLLGLKKQPVAAFGILFFLLGHSIESSVLALELVHEHRNYLPSYGLLFALFYYLLYPLRHRQSLVLRQAVASILIVGFGTVTFLRATTWGDPVEMKFREVAHHPNSVRANLAVAVFYYAMPALSQRDAEEFYLQAYNYFVKAAELSPSDTLGLFGLIVMDSKRGVAVEESWVRALAGRLLKYPFSANSGNSLSALEGCVSSGYCKLPPDNMATLMQAALHNPSLQGKARAQALFAWSNFLFRVKHQLDESARAAYQAMEATPYDMDNQINLITMLINCQKLLDAQQQISKARQLDGQKLYAAKLDELQQLHDKLSGSASAILESPKAN